VCMLVSDLFLQRLKGLERDPASHSKLIQRKGGKKASSANPCSRTCVHAMLHTERRRTLRRNTQHQHTEVFCDLPAVLRVKSSNKNWKKECGNFLRSPFIA